MQPPFLRRNHDQSLERPLDDPHPPRLFDNWLKPANGGAQTLASYGIDSTRPADELQAALTAALPPEHANFLHGLRNSLQTDEAFYCHAGVDRGRPLDQQPQEMLVSGSGQFLMDDRDFSTIIVHGHYQAHAPVMRPNRIGVDTAGYMTGNLTAVRIARGERPRFIQTCAY